MGVDYDDSTMYTCDICGTEDECTTVYGAKDKPKYWSWVEGFDVCDKCVRIIRALAIPNVIEKE